MMTITKTITFPDGEQAKLVASYENNLQLRIPAIVGPEARVLGVLEQQRLSAISGVDLAQCFDRVFESAGCRVENTMDGEWEMFKE